MTGWALTSRNVDRSASLSGVLLLGIGLLVGQNRGFAFTIWSAAAIAYGGFTVFRLLSERRFMLGSLQVFLFYSAAVVWFFNFALRGPMSSWRSGWELTSAFIETLGSYLLYLTFFGIICHLALLLLPKVRISPFKAVSASFSLPIMILSVICGVILIGIAGTQARDEYLLSAGVGTMFLVQSTSLFVAGLFAFSLFMLPKGAARTQGNLLLLLVALVVAANGFRYILVIFLFISAFYFLKTRRVSGRARWWIALGIAMSYYLLLVLAYTRSVGMTFLQALAFAFNPDITAAAAYVGAQDQSGFILQDHFIHNPAYLMGQTYWDAFLRLAPNVVHTTFFDTVRAQDFIIQAADFLPDVFRENNWTMGSHLFVEAIINFGPLGPYLMLAIFGSALIFLERQANSSRPLYVGYIVMAGMGYALAWYGFANFLKQSAFALLASYAIWYLCRLTLSPGSDVRSNAPPRPRYRPRASGTTRSASLKR